MEQSLAILILLGLCTIIPVIASGFWVWMIVSLSTIALDSESTWTKATLLVIILSSFLFVVPLFPVYWEWITTMLDMTIPLAREALSL